MKLNKIGSDIKAQAKKLSEEGFQQIFDHIDQLNVKKGVDKMGLDKFIDQCAYLAAGSGVISGSGGMITMLVGMPVDFINLITQQFRITMAINYYNRGDYQIEFRDFISLIAVAFKVDAGVTITKTLLERIAEKLLLIFGTRAAERMIPIVGGVIGGATNYMFIKRMAKQIKQMHFIAEPAIIV